MRDLIETHMADPETNPHGNVSLWTHGTDDVDLPPESCDVVLMSQITALLVAPERMPWISRQELFPWPKFFGARYADEERLLRSIHTALRSGGRMVVINMLDVPEDPYAVNKLFFFYAHDEAEVIANYEALGFRLVKRDDLYLDQAHQESMRRFRQEPEYPTFARFFLGRPKFFMIFEKVGPATQP
jgi:hypothetical protein